MFKITIEDEDGTQTLEGNGALIIIDGECYQTILKGQQSLLNFAAVKTMQMAVDHQRSDETKG